MIYGHRVVDVHHHFLPSTVFTELKEMAGGAPRLVNDRISMTLSDDLHRPRVHLDVMDQAGVDHAVLTYSGISVFGIDTCHRLNDGLAEVAADHPSRFSGAAHLPLQDPMAACGELQRCAGELGFPAAALPTSIPGVDLDSPSLGQLWQLLAELDLPVILHPALLPTGSSTAYSLERSCARPFDTTVAAVRLLCGVLPSHPTLRFVLPHCGGTAVFLQGRLRMFYQPPGAPGRVLPRTVREQHELGYHRPFADAWSRLWFDTAGTGGWAPAVRMTLETAGPLRLLFGSDYPLESHSAGTLAELLAVVRELPGPADAVAAVLGGNAAELFRLTDRCG